MAARPCRAIRVGRVQYFVLEEDDDKMWLAARCAGDVPTGVETGPGPRRWVTFFVMKSNAEPPRPRRLTERPVLDLEAPMRASEQRRFVAFLEGFTTHGSGA